jgi:ABC-type lipoprotein export system ATPase subunit
MDLLLHLNKVHQQTFVIVTHAQDIGAMLHRIIRMKDGGIVAD